MAYTKKIDANSQYRVEIVEKCSVAGLNLRPGTEAILIGSAVTELGEAVKVIDKVEG